MNGCGESGEPLNKWEHLICAKSSIFVLQDQLLDRIYINNRADYEHTSPSGDVHSQHTRWYHIKDIASIT